MPIEVMMPITPVSQAEFRDRDYQITREAFAVHDDLGRLWNEAIYQAELAERCRGLGLGPVDTEVGIRISHEGFTTTLYMDMIVNGGLLYELKAAEVISPPHKKQTLNYLLLAGLHHGKILNFRPASLESWYVSTRLTSEGRRRYRLVDHGWQSDKRSQWLRQHVERLIQDWGLFLEIDLFYAALHHLAGGEERLVRPVTIQRGKRMLGTQWIHALDETTAFKISAVTRATRSYADHLRRFLSYTGLSRLHWINLQHHTVAFQTLTI